MEDRRGSAPPGGTHPIFSVERSVVKLGNAYYVALPGVWIKDHTKKVAISVLEMTRDYVIIKVERVEDK